MSEQDEEIRPGDVLQGTDPEETRYVSWVDDEVAYDEDGEEIGEFGELKEDWEVVDTDFAVCSRETLFSEVNLLLDEIADKAETTEGGVFNTDTSTVVQGGSDWDHRRDEADELITEVLDHADRLQKAWNELKSR